MAKPALEVADIFRRHGQEFLRSLGDSLSVRQQRVMRAIELCRTAALGGHVEQCDHCGHRALSDSKVFARLLDDCRRTEWVVYAKPPFGGPQQVLDYLARYTSAFVRYPELYLYPKTRSWNRPIRPYCPSKNLSLLQKLFLLFRSPPTPSYPTAFNTHSIMAV
jgi:hypothetical protein